MNKNKDKAINNLMQKVSKELSSLDLMINRNIEDYHAYYNGKKQGLVFVLAELQYIASLSDKTEHDGLSEIIESQLYPPCRVPDPTECMFPKTCDRCKNL